MRYLREKKTRKTWFPLHSEDWVDDSKVLHLDDLRIGQWQTGYGELREGLKKFGWEHTENAVCAAQPPSIQKLKSKTLQQGHSVTHANIS